MSLNRQYKPCILILQPGPLRGLGGAQGKYKKWGPQNGLCEGVMSPGNVEILHARGLVEFINFENDRKCGLLAFFGSSFV